MPFSKGQSGNPKGLKPGTLLFTPLLRRKLLEKANGDQTYVEAALDSYVKELLKGKPSDIEGMLDRTDGKPKSSDGELGSEDNPIHTVHKVLWE